MDDGNIKMVGLYLNTQGFTYNENIKLSKCLMNTFGFKNITVNKDKNYYRLYISQYDKEKFITIVKPYILPIFLYKLDL